MKIEVKTFDLNDADATEEDGNWVFRFPGRPETVSIGVMKMGNFVKGEQKTVFHYNDGNPVIEPIKTERKGTELWVHCDDEIVIFKHINEAIVRLMAKPEEFTFTFCDENDNPVKKMSGETIGSTLEGVSGLIENAAKLLGLPKPKIEVKFNGCIGDMTFLISYQMKIEMVEK